jgi:hypothetical protein
VFDFLIQWGALTSRLSELLGARYVPGSREQAGAIGYALGNVIRLHNAGRFLDRDVEVLRLMLVAKQLAEVQTHDPAMFARLKRRMRHGSLSDFYGARQELSVASKLVRTCMPYEYERPGHPDFLFENGAAIECTSVHVVGEPDHDAFYKLGAALRTKSGKPYAGPLTAVAIGTTNIDARGAVERDKEEVAAVLGETPHGAVILFTTMLNMDRFPPRLETNYRRIDGAMIAPALSKILNVLYPFGAHSVERRVIARAP